MQLKPFKTRKEATRKARRATTHIVGRVDLTSFGRGSLKLPLPGQPPPARPGQPSQRPPVATFGRPQDAFDSRAVAEIGAQKVDERRLMKDLTRLCKDPLLYVRDATDPAAYRRSAEYVANQLAAAGVQPLGDANTGGPSFLQSFWWEPSFGDDRTPVQSWNVVGMIPGTRRQQGLPSDAFVLIGHLDNLSQAEKDWYRKRDGRDLTGYQGASDNASAVVTLLEAARALAESGPLEHDVIFFIPSGEEDGLKGSEAFVRAPPVPLNQIRGVLNFEMVGFDRHLIFGGSHDVEARRNPLYQRARDVAERSGATLLPGAPNDQGEGWWRRSDHFPFHAEGIPSVMVLGQPPPGVYHTAEDRIERCDSARIRDAAQFALRLAADLFGDHSAPERRNPPARRFTNHYEGRVWPGEAAPASR
jgi:hypothetical protein